MNSDSLNMVSRLGEGNMPCTFFSLNLTVICSDCTDFCLQTFVYNCVSKKNHILEMKPIAQLKKLRLNIHTLNFVIAKSEDDVLRIQNTNL